MVVSHKRTGGPRQLVELQFRNLTPRPQNENQSQSFPESLAFAENKQDEGHPKSFSLLVALSIASKDESVVILLASRDSDGVRMDRLFHFGTK